MANKKKKVDEDKQAKKIEKAIKKTVKKGAKKAMKNKTFVISAIAVVLVIAIALTALYFVRPDIVSTLLNFNNESSQNSAQAGGNNEQNRPSTIYEGDLAVYFLDIGQGDCIYIAFPDGKDMLIDAGNANFYTSTNANYQRILTSLKEYNQDDIIDYVMVTHGDKDHVSVMDDIIGEFQVNKIFMPNIRPSDEKLIGKGIDETKLAMFTDEDQIDTDVYVDFFVAALTEPNCEIVLNIGEFSIIEETYRFDFYCLTQEQWTENKLKDAEEKNEVSPIGILEYNGKRIVFTGDSNELNEPHFVKRVKAIDCDVLKVGHHGSATSSTDQFLDAITCEYAVISCNAAGNTFKHPRQAALDRLVARNYTGIYRTDLHGSIIMVISKDVITFTTEKQAAYEDIIKGANN